MNTRSRIATTLLAAGICLGISQAARAADGHVSVIYIDDGYGYYPGQISLVHGYAYPRYNHHDADRYGHRHRHHGKRHHRHHGHSHKRHHDHHARHWR